MLQSGYKLCNQFVIFMRRTPMADKKEFPLTYKGHPLRRKDNLIY